jgi:hypothetical protein
MQAGRMKSRSGLAGAVAGYFHQCSSEIAGGIDMAPAQTQSAADAARQALAPFLRLAGEMRGPLSSIAALAYYIEMNLPIRRFLMIRYMYEIRQFVDHVSRRLNDAIDEAEIGNQAHAIKRKAVQP